MTAAPPPHPAPAAAPPALLDQLLHEARAYIARATRHQNHRCVSSRCGRQESDRATLAALFTPIYTRFQRPDAGHARANTGPSGRMRRNVGLRWPRLSPRSATPPVMTRRRAPWRRPVRGRRGRAGPAGGGSPLGDEQQHAIDARRDRPAVRHIGDGWRVDQHDIRLRAQGGEQRAEGIRAEQIRRVHPPPAGREQEQVRHARLDERQEHFAILIRAEDRRWRSPPSRSPARRARSGCPHSAPRAGRHRRQ